MENSIVYDLDFHPAVKKDLKSISDSTTRTQIEKAVLGLRTKPEGQVLSHLKGLRKIKCAKGRYRIVFSVDHAARLVTVVAIGKRQSGDHDDPYTLAASRI